jgi:hypothetical protein
MALILCNRQKALAASELVNSTAQRRNKSCDICVASSGSAASAVIVADMARNPGFPAAPVDRKKKKHFTAARYAVVAGPTGLQLQKEPEELGE